MQGLQILVLHCSRCYSTAGPALGVEGDQQTINWVYGSAAYKLVDPSTGRSCNMYFPKLRHCYFLTALHGWLLVAGPSVDTSSPEDGEGFRAIFFHPFSRTMVILPYLYLPHGIDKYDLLFDFTAPPTSPNASSSSSNSESTGRGGRARASMEKSNGHPATTRISTI